MELEPNTYYFLEAKSKPGFYLKYVTRDKHGIQIWPSYRVKKGTYGAWCIKGKHIPLVPDQVSGLNLEDFNTVLIPNKKQKT